MKTGVEGVIFYFGVYWSLPCHKMLFRKEGRKHGAQPHLRAHFPSYELCQGRQPQHSRMNTGIPPSFPTIWAWAWNSSSWIQLLYLQSTNMDELVSRIPFRNKRICVLTKLIFMSPEQKELNNIYWVFIQFWAFLPVVQILGYALESMSRPVPLRFFFIWTEAEGHWEIFKSLQVTQMCLDCYKLLDIL